MINIIIALLGSKGATGNPPTAGTNQVTINGQPLTINGQPLTIQQWI